MFQIRPLNAAAVAQSNAIIPTKSGIVIGQGYSAMWKRRLLPFLRRATEGDVLTPGGTQRLVAGTQGGAALSAAAIKVALANPEASDLAVFDVTPKSGKFLLRISQVALALGIVYLAGGVFVGVALPTGLRYVSIFYGGGLSTTKAAKVKEVISDFGVFKEHKVDDQTKKFFEAIKAAKGETKKEETK